MDKDIERTVCEGDVSVGNDVAIGGSVVVQGKTHLKGSVSIDGWLDAPNIRSVNKGLFSTLEKLQAAFPEPTAGWWAIVGDMANGYVYCVENNKWTATSTKYKDVLNAELDNFVEFENIDRKIAKINGIVGDNGLVYALPGSSLEGDERFTLVIADSSFVKGNGMVDDDNNRYALPSSESTEDENTLASKKDVNSRQEKLESGKNIKSFNGESILGEGNIEFATINGKSIFNGGNIVTGEKERAIYTECVGAFPPVVRLTDEQLAQADAWDRESLDYNIIVSNPLDNSRSVVNLFTLHKMVVLNYDSSCYSSCVRTFYTANDATQTGKLISVRKIGNPTLVFQFEEVQEKLESGVNIKTFNGESILGEGDIKIEASEAYDDTEIKESIKTLSDEKVDATDIATINGQSIINGGNITIEGGGSESSKKSISILFVGNSLTQDGIAYLPYMLKNYYPEIDFKIYMWYTGGYTLGQHYSTFTSGGKAAIFSVAENAEGWTNYDKSKTMAQVLSAYTFDIVCMQEYFNYKTEFTEATDWNNCRNYILTNYKGGNPLKFISLFHAPLRKDGYDVDEVYKRTEDGNALILQTTISEDVIPNGIAVYRALETDLNSLGDLGQLSPDGTHTQEGLPCLLQTYVTLCWLFEKLGINKSIYGHPMRMTTDIYNKISVPGANLGKGVVQGTEAQNILAQEVAIKAYKEGKQFLMRNLYPFEWGGGLRYGTFTINCNVADAIIKINGLEQTSVTAIIGSTITWEVTKEDYRPQSGTFVLSGDKDLNVVLLPIVDIASISAEFSQGQRTIFNEDEIEDLRKYLVVSVNYANGSSEVTEDYTLSGTLSGGTSVITASFGDKDTTFEVEVTDVVIPEGYTRYGWVSCNKTSKTGKAPSYYIYLTADEDWNRLSMECYIGKRPNVTHASGSGLFGARLASSDNSNPWYGMYVPTEHIRVDARNTNVVIPYPSDKSKIKVVLDNRQTSPMYASANDGAVVEHAWTKSDVINVPMSLLNNIPNGSTTNMNFNIYFRIGEMKFRDYDGRCVYYYIPVVDSSNKIGMFDVINQRFCTAATAAAVTIGNSSCVHEVGNW